MGVMKQPNRGDVHGNGNHNRNIAKNVFHLHGAMANGEMMFRKKLTRAKLLTFVGKQAPCLVVMEAVAALVIGAEKSLKRAMKYV